MHGSADDLAGAGFSVDKDAAVGVGAMSLICWRSAFIGRCCR